MRVKAGTIRAKVRAYWTSLKSLQTGLLTLTGLAGYMSVSGSIISWQRALALIGSLFLAIAGSTMLNMVCDRDIDAKMERHRRRPLPSGVIEVRQALSVGLILAVGGVSWAFAMNWIYGLVVFAGLFFDVVIYTMWLKRRTSWSIALGGIAGGMPILAGRVLGMGQVDRIGLLLAMAVLLWIPIHIITFSIKYADDYRRADVPVFPNTHGVQAARRIICISTAAAVVVMALTVRLLGLAPGSVYFVYGLSALLLGFTVMTMMRNSPKKNFVLFKLASIYMLSSMLAIIIGT